MLKPDGSGTVRAVGEPDGNVTVITVDGPELPLPLPLPAPPPVLIDVPLGFEEAPP